MSQRIWGPGDTDTLSRHFREAARDLTLRRPVERTGSDAPIGCVLDRARSYLLGAYGESVDAQEAVRRLRDRDRERAEAAAYHAFKQAALRGTDPSVLWDLARAPAPAARSGRVREVGLEIHAARLAVARTLHKHHGFMKGEADAVTALAEAIGVSWSALVVVAPGVRMKVVGLGVARTAAELLAGSRRLLPLLDRELHVGRVVALASAEAHRIHQDNILPTNREGALKTAQAQFHVRVTRAKEGNTLPVSGCETSAMTVSKSRSELRGLLKLLPPNDD